VRTKWLIMLILHLLSENLMIMRYYRLDCFVLIIKIWISQIVNTSTKIISGKTSKTLYHTILMKYALGLKIMQIRTIFSPFREVIEKISKFSNYLILEIWRSSLILLNLIKQYHNNIRWTKWFTIKWSMKWMKIVSPQIMIIWIMTMTVNLYSRLDQRTWKTAKRCPIAAIVDRITLTMRESLENAKESLQTN